MIFITLLTLTEFALVFAALGGIISFIVMFGMHTCRLLRIILALLCVLFAGLFYFFALNIHKAIPVTTTSSITEIERVGMTGEVLIGDGSNVVRAAEQFAILTDVQIRSNYHISVDMRRIYGVKQKCNPSIKVNEQ